MRFPEQQPGEEIVLVIRKHFIVYLGLLLNFFMVFIFPLFLVFPFLFAYFRATHPQGVLIAEIFACMYVLYGLAFLMVAWMEEAFDLFVLTNQHLVDITQISFFRRSVTATPLLQIQDTASHVDGFWATMLNYGSVDVQTAAGGTSIFSISRVPDPPSVSRAILSEAQKAKNTGSHPPEAPAPA